MIRRTIQCSALALGAAALFVLAGCQTGPQTEVTWQPNGMPHHTHPTQDWWHYQFVYHPEAQVYFEPYSHMYYWFEGGEWKQGHFLPGTITLDKSLARPVVLKAPIPHAHHETVVVSDGPGYGRRSASSWPDFFDDDQFMVEPSMIVQQPTE